MLATVAEKPEEATLNVSKNETWRSMHGYIKSIGKTWELFGKWPLGATRHDEDRLVGCSTKNSKEYP